MVGEATKSFTQVDGNGGRVPSTGTQVFSDQWLQREEILSGFSQLSDPIFPPWDSFDG